MSLKQKEVQNAAFFKRIIPFFQTPNSIQIDEDSEEERQRVQDQVQEEAMKFAKLGMIFNIIPPYDQKIAMSCVNLMLDNKETFKPKAEEIFYFLCKYHVENRYTIDCSKIGLKEEPVSPEEARKNRFVIGMDKIKSKINPFDSEFDPREIRMIDEVFDTYSAAIPHMQNMYSIDNAFVFGNDFNSTQHPPRLMDLFRIEMACQTMYNEALSQNPQDYQDGLNKLRTLGNSSLPFVTKAMTDSCDQLLDAFSLTRKAQRPSPNL